MTQPTQTPGQRLDACLTPHLATQQRLAAQLSAQQEQMLALTRAIESTRQEIENLEFQMATAVRVSAQADPGLRRILGLNVQDVANAHELLANPEAIQAQPEPTVAVVEGDLDEPMPHGVSGPDRVCARVHREPVSEEDDLDLELDLEDAFDAPEAVLTDAEPATEAPIETEAAAEPQALTEAEDTPAAIDAQDDVVVETPEVIDADAIAVETTQDAEPETEAEADEDTAEAQALVAALGDALCDSLVDTQIDSAVEAAEATQQPEDKIPEAQAEATQSEAEVEVETEAELVDPNDPLAGIDMNAFDSTDTDDKQAAA